MFNSLHRPEVLQGRNVALHVHADTRETLGQDQDAVMGCYKVVQCLRLHLRWEFAK